MLHLNLKIIIFFVHPQCHFHQTFLNFENLFIVHFSERKLSKLYDMKIVHVSVRQRGNHDLREVPLFVLGLIFICQIY